MQRIPRRDFLAGLGAAGFATLAGGWPEAAWGRALARHVGDIPVVVGGEDNRVGHMLRDGHVFKLPPPSRKCDVVIVGAGVSGLVAAYNLRDADVLVIEKEDRPGGHARKGHWHDVTYSEGAAYVEDTSGYVGELIHTLGIPLKPITQPADGMHLAGRTFGEILGGGARHLPGTLAERQGFERFVKELHAIKDDLPPLPVEDANAAQLKTDLHSFADWARPYGPLVHTFLDLYCRSALGGPVEAVSTYWGLGFVGGEDEVKYTAPGGNAAYAEALYHAVGPQRVQLGATVVRVVNVGDRVRVSYVVGDEVVTVEAKAAILAIAKHIIRRVVPGLPKDQDAAMAQMRYEPYLVTNVLVDGPCQREAYDTWVPGAPFTDVVVADWVNREAGRKHAVLTAYCPVVEGDRYKLLDAVYPTHVARQAVATLDSMQPGLAARVKEVRVFRWGHPMVLSSVGAITHLRPLVTRPFERIFIAGGDNQMCATIEAAVHEGRKQAQLARAKLATAKGAAAGRVG